MCATASIPIAAALISAGLPTGAALVFLMVGPATNLATLGAVRGAFGTRVTLVYLLNIALGSALLGLAFEALFPFAENLQVEHIHEHVDGWSYASAVALWGLFTWFGFVRLRDTLRNRRINRPSNSQTLELPVQGLTCDGCVRKLTRALTTAPGVSGVTVVREPAGQATVVGTGHGFSRESIAHAIEQAGFRVC